MDWTWYLFGFNGRINRAKYWLAGLIVLAFMMIFVALLYLALTVDFVAHAMGTAHVSGEVSFGFSLDDIFSALDPAAWRALSFARLPVLLVKAAGMVLFLWIFLATSIKRLHDRDKSAWWMVPFFLVPGLYGHFAEQLPDSYWVLPLALIAFVLCVWAFIELYFLGGSRKTNRFGPNPLQPVTTEKRWEQHSEIEMVPHTASPPPVWRVKREA